jgi:hypothetical protein
MHHLVQQRVLYLRPRMPGNVPPADRNLIWPASLPIYRELAEPAPHPTREPNGNVAQRSAEVLRVQLPMPGLQPVQ